MKLPNFKRLNKSDFKQDFQELIDGLSFSLNSGIESVYEALNRKLTFTDNFSSTIYNGVVNVDSDGKLKSTVTFNVSSSNVMGLFVISAKTNGSSLPTGTPFCVFEQNNKTIKVNYIRGFPANQDFTVTIIAIDN